MKANDLDLVCSVWGCVMKRERVRNERGGEGGEEREYESRDTRKDIGQNRLACFLARLDAMRTNESR